MNHTLKRAAIVTLAVLVASAPRVPANAASVTATLDSSEIALGETAQLTVTVQGQSTEAPQIPAVNGLTFQPVGQSSQIEIVNGAMSANVNYLYAVAASRSATFTIPPINKFSNGPDAAQSLPIDVESAFSMPAEHRPRRPARIKTLCPANRQRQRRGQSFRRARTASAFCAWSPPRRNFTWAKWCRWSCKAYFRAGVELRVDGLPSLNSDAFTMNKLGDQPLSSQQVIDGVRYTVFTWPTAITAVKAGDYQMSVEIPVTVTERQQAQRSRWGDPFDDDAFADVFNRFFGAATQKQITLNSEPNPVKILSLPAENRPAGFTGAVGRFDLAAEAGPAQIAAGDPVTFKLKISGAGNFDRVTAPPWKRAPHGKLTSRAQNLNRATAMAIPAPRTSSRRSSRPRQASWKFPHSRSVTSTRSKNSMSRGPRRR